MVKGKLVKELLVKNEELLGLIVDGSEQYDDFMIIREIFEQYCDELETISEDLVDE